MMGLTNKEQVKVAAIQMVSSTDKLINLETASYWVEQAAKQGAVIIALPEYFCFMGFKDLDKNEHAEIFGAGPIQDHLSALARKHQVYLIGGSLPLRSDEKNRFYNSCLVYAPNGICIVRYDKIHLFGFTQGAEHYDESKAIVAGKTTPTIIDTSYGKIGLGICYDLRFPELFRAMGEVDILVFPSAFTYTTGQAHWEILLRARAIENQCYVIAPAQGGQHLNGRRTWGHSMIIDPWGDILTVIETDAGFVCADLFKERLQSVRQSLPALSHRRFELLKDIK